RAAERGVAGGRAALRRIVACAEREHAEDDAEDRHAGAAPDEDPRERIRRRPFVAAALPGDALRGGVRGLLRDLLRLVVPLLLVRALLAHAGLERAHAAVEHRALVLRRVVVVDAQVVERVREPAEALLRVRDVEEEERPRRERVRLLERGDRFLVPALFVRGGALIEERARLLVPRVGAVTLRVRGRGDRRQRDERDEQRDGSRHCPHGSLTSPPWWPPPPVCVSP